MILANNCIFSVAFNLDVKPTKTWTIMTNNNVIFRTIHNNYFKP